MYDEQRLEVGSYIRLKDTVMNELMEITGAIAVITGINREYKFFDIKILTGKFKGGTTLEFYEDEEMTMEKFEVIPEKVAFLEVL